MANLFKFVQAQFYTLAGSGVSMGASTLTLQSFKDIDGVNLTITDFGTRGYMTLEPGSGTLEESISFTGVTQNGNGTATLTGVSSVGFKAPYTVTANVAKSHAGGVKAVLTNTAGFYNEFVAKNDDSTITQTVTFTTPNFPIVTNSATFPTLPAQLTTKAYVDSLIAAGAPDASTTTKGIGFISSNPAVSTAPTFLNAEEVTATPTAFAVSRADVDGTLNSWVDAGGSLGDGSDGNVTVSAPLTLARDMFYNNLTINAGGVITPAGFKIFVKNTFTNNVVGGIVSSGGNAGDGAAGTTGGFTGGAGGTAGASAAGTLLSAPPGVAGGVGGGARDGGSPPPVSGANALGTSVLHSLGIAGANGGSGGGTTGAQNAGGGLGTGGTATAAIIDPRFVAAAEFAIDMAVAGIGYYHGNGGAGGGGGGGGGFAASNSDVAGAGGGGGGSGGNGGTIWILAKTFNNLGSFIATGGNGGNGGVGGNFGSSGFGSSSGGGGGAGGAGGSGGLVFLVYKTLVNLGTITVTGGLAGTGAAAGTSGGGGSAAAGSNGTAGVAGVVRQLSVV